MENLEIAAKLEQMADLLEIQDANPFRVRAYRNAARVVGGYGEPLRKLVEAGDDLTEIEAIGQDMAGYISELVETGHLRVLEELEKQVPRGLLDMTRIPGLGPKRAARLWDELGVTTLDELAAAARQGRIAGLKGFGKKTEEQIAEGIEEFQAAHERVLISVADDYVEALLEHMHEARDVLRIEVAGSWRRRRETVGDLDVLVTARRVPPVMEHFTGWRSVKKVLGSGETKASVVLQTGLQVDLRIVPARSFGAALVYFTGSKAHNIKLRRRALDRKLHISEYGVFRMQHDRETERKRPSEGEWVAGREEKDVYEAVGLPWVPPELREDRGEVELAERRKLPRLLDARDIRGDLQMHSTWTDGRDSVAQMIHACAERGYEYAAITDHSKSLPMLGGLDEKKLRQQMERIDAIAEKYPDIRILKSCEVDVLRDGSLDLDDRALEELDVVLVSVHSHLDLPVEKQTRRIVKALEHPLVHILGHPTSRIIGRRAPMKLDIDEILLCAREHGVAVELDAHPNRLDLPDTLLIRAKELRVPVIISSDAHSTDGLSSMRYGVEQARRAGLEKGDVLNTRPLKQFLEALDSKAHASAG